MEDKLKNMLCLWVILYKQSFIFKINIGSFIFQDEFKVHWFIIYLKKCIIWKFFFSSLIHLYTPFISE